jgi:tetratricopeptide (TPR) repeat protein
MISEDGNDDWIMWYEGEEDSEAGLVKIIQNAREALASSPPDHPHRAARATSLGDHLYMRYDYTGDISLLIEAIDAQREALALRLPGHPDRAISCANLAVSLRVRCKQTGDVGLLDEAIELKREALALQPPGHPDRADICTNLGASLNVRYNQTGDIQLLDEAIQLEHEALALRPPGHPDHASSCASLAAILHLHFNQAGDIALLDEAIKLERVALVLQPLGHPGHASSCANLAASLLVRFERDTNIALLDEAIELEREALASRSLDHPHRGKMCADLGSSLCVRYQQTGDVMLLTEAIKLQSNALVLHPLGHPARADSCTKLASSLQTLFDKSGNVMILDIAIKSVREALALRPSGHPSRAYNCCQLAGLLLGRHKQTGNVTLLDEAIKLHREALASRPVGHPERGDFCLCLVASLHARFEQTGDVALLDEAIEACIYASEHSSASRAWYSLTRLSFLHLLRDSPHYSISKALDYLQQSLQHEVHDLYYFIEFICNTVTLIWDNSSGWASGTTASLVAIYAQVVDRLPLVANFVLNTSSQLQSLEYTRRLGTDACVAALLAGRPATAVALLDCAQGVVWTQALHQRDPQLEDAPRDLAIELDNLLRAIATSTGVKSARLPDHDQDLRHRQNTRIQAILREIRAIPGLTRFMLGSSYKTLREAARDHTVVLLVAGHGHAFAIIMPSSASANPDLLPLDVAWNDLRSLANTAGRANLRYRAGSTERQRAEASGQETPLAESTDQERAMRNGNFGSEWSPLASLWRNVVKPVLAHLNFTVSHPGIAYTPTVLTWALSEKG